MASAPFWLLAYVICCLPNLYVCIDWSMSAGGQSIGGTTISPVKANATDVLVEEPPKDIPDRSPPVRPDKGEDVPPSVGDTVIAKLLKGLQDSIDFFVEKEKVPSEYEPQIMIDLRKQSFLVSVFGVLLKVVKWEEFSFQIRNGFSSMSTCFGCQILAKILLLPLMFPTFVIVRSLKMVCVAFKINKPFICNDIIDSFEKPLDYVRHNSILTSIEVCGVLFSTKCSGIETSKLKWEIDLPAKASDGPAKADAPAKAESEGDGAGGPEIDEEIGVPPDARRKREVTSGPANTPAPGTVTIPTDGWKESNFFIQITDIHIDPDYVEGNVAKCGDPICCRPGHGKAATPPEGGGHWGDYRNCDSPLILLEDAVKQAIESHPEARFILWSGDVVPHNVWNVTKEQVRDVFTKSTNIFKKYAKIPVIPTLGNHDAVPVNGFAPPHLDANHSTAWLYAFAADQWSSFLPKEALDTFRIAGYYKLDLGPKLVLLSPNSNYCTRLNPWTLLDPRDPAGQLKWLTEELFKAETEGKLVHIAMHVPPDNRECYQAWLYNYIRIVERFQATITGQYYGHTHYDEVRVIYSLTDQTEAVGVEFLGPSISPYSHTNPAYRLYYMDKEGTLVDHHTYYINLTEFNEGSKELKWTKEYEAKEYYGLKSMSPKEWGNVVKKMEDEDKTWIMFYRNYMSRTDFPGVAVHECGNDTYILRDCDRKNVISDQQVISAFVYGNKEFDFG